MKENEKRKRGREANMGERKKRIERERKKKDFPGFSTVREEKSIHASWATRGYQNLGVSSNSAR